nr:MAG TPA: hypothetical protein [Caudoviricetes sp.]
MTNQRLHRAKQEKKRRILHVIRRHRKRTRPLPNHHIHQQARTLALR